MGKHLFTRNLKVMLMAMSFEKAAAIRAMKDREIIPVLTAYDFAMARVMETDGILRGWPP